MRGLIILITSLILICSLFARESGKLDLTSNQTDTPQRLIALSQHQEHHILYGDNHGGGHLHGQNKDCKSEFPASWDAEKIIATIKAQAANDNLDWRTGQNGYKVADATVDNVRLRVVVNPARDHIITAYPVNGPRNACAR